MKNTKYEPKIAYTNHGTLSKSEFPKANMKITTHTASPATEPNIKADQLVFSVYWLILSIRRPNRFIEAFSTNNAISSPMSYTPKSSAINRNNFV